MPAQRDPANVSTLIKDEREWGVPLKNLSQICARGQKLKLETKSRQYHQGEKVKGNQEDGGVGLFLPIFRGGIVVVEADDMDVSHEFAWKSHQKR